MSPKALHLFRFALAVIERARFGLRGAGATTAGHPRRTLLVPAICVAIAIMAIGPYTASAQSGGGAHTPVPLQAHIQPVGVSNPGSAPIHVFRKQVPGTTGGSPSASSTASTAATNMTYHSGQVMPSSKTYAIFWLPAGHHFETAGAGAAGDSSYESLIERYFQDIGSSPMYNILTQYSDSGGNLVQNGPITNSSTFGGAYVDTRAYPSNPLYDPDLRTAIADARSAKGWGTGWTNEYFVFTGNGIASCFDSSQTDCTYQQYCAYHSAYPVSSAPIIYANMPDEFSLNPGGDCGKANPNGDEYADVEISTISHEHFEAVTDPWPETGWHDTNGGEIGDKCAYNYGPAVDPFSHPSQPNIYLNSDPYIVQQEWSNDMTDCGLSLCATTVCSATVPISNSGPTMIDGQTSDDVVYTLNYQDTSNVDQATSLVLTDTLPPGLSYKSSTPAPTSINGQTLKWTISDLAPHQSGTITLHASPAPGLPNGTVLTNAASLAFSDSQAMVQTPSTASAQTTVGTPQPTAPGKVTGVSASGGIGQISVNWSTPNDGGSAITGYVLSYSDGTTTSTQTAAAGDTSATITGLPNGTAYSLTVAAVNDVGTGTASDPANATTDNVPGTPRNLQVTPSDSQLSASWQAPASDGGSAVTGYTVTCSPSCGSTNTTNTTDTVTGLTNGTQYVISVAASNLVGQGTAASSAAVAPVPAPHLPQNLQLTPGDGQILAQWNPPLDGADPNGYTVGVFQSDGVTPAGGASQGSPGCDTSQTPALCSTTVTGLTNGTGYAVSVSGYNDAGNGPSISAAMTPYTYPASPVNLQAAPSDGQATIVWSPGSNGGSAVDRYDVSVGSASSSVDPNSGACSLNSSSTVVCSAVFSGLTDGAHYSVAVQAHNAAGDGPAALTTVVPNAAPTLIVSNPAPSVAYGSNLSFTVTAHDAESSDRLTFRSIAGTLPTGLKTQSLPASGFAPLGLTVTGRVTAPAGFYQATFAISDGFNPDVTVTVPITVTKQTVYMVAAGSSSLTNPPAPVLASGSPAVSGSLTFAAIIKEIFYGTGSQIDSKTPFTVSLNPVGGGTPIGTSTCTTTGYGYAGPITSNLRGACTVSHVPVGVYDVHMAIAAASAYFQGSYDGVLTVYASGWKDYGSGSISRVINTTTRYAANFGFLLAPCSVGGSTVTQGMFLYIEHRTPGHANGDVVVSSPDSSTGAAIESCALSGTTVKTAMLSGTADRSDQPGSIFGATVTAIGGLYPKLGLAVSDGSTPTDISFAPLTIVYGGKMITG